MKNAATSAAATQLTATSDAVADSEDDEQWGSGKLVIDLEACQDAAASHSKPDANESAAPVERVDVPAQPRSSEPRSDEVPSLKQTSNTDGSVGAKDELANDKLVKLNTKRKTTKKPSGGGPPAAAIPKTDSAADHVSAASTTTSGGKKEKPSGKKRASGSRTASGRSCAGDTASASDKRDASSSSSAKAARRKRKDRPPSRRGAQEDPSAAAGSGAQPAAAQPAAAKATACAGTAAALGPTDVSAGDDSSGASAPSTTGEPQPPVTDGPRGCSKRVAKALAANAVAAATEATARVASCDAATDTADAQSVAVATEPECLGPCEPGTHVNLDGIVWQETTNGVLVVNVTWRGKTYVGALLDATKHDWAPPRLQSESPTSDIESRTPKGRGNKRRLPPATSASACFQDINERKLRQQGRRCSQQQPLLPPPSPARSEASTGGGGTKRKSIRGATGAEAAPTAEATSDPEPGAVPTVGGGGSGPPPAKRGRTNSRCSGSSAAFAPPGIQLTDDVATPVSSADVVSGDGSSSTGGVPAAPSAAAQSIPPPAPSQQYVECREPNCSKKYKNVSGLRYHQSHAHGIAADVLRSQTPAKDGRGSMPGSPATLNTTRVAATDAAISAGADASCSGGCSIGEATADDASRGSRLQTASEAVAVTSPMEVDPQSSCTSAAAAAGNSSSHDGGGSSDEELGKRLAAANGRLTLNAPTAAAVGARADGSSEQVEPTDLSVTARRTVAAAAASAAAATRGGLELTAPKLEPVDGLDLPVPATLFPPKRRVQRSPAEPLRQPPMLPPTSGASGAAFVVGSGGGGPPLPGSAMPSPPGASTVPQLGGSGSSGLQLMAAGVPVAAIQPQVVKPSPGSAAAADSRTLSAATGYPRAKPAAAAPASAQQPSPAGRASLGSSATSAAAVPASSQPKLLPRGGGNSVGGGGGPTKTSSAGSVAAGQGSTMLLGQLAAASSGGSLAHSGTLSLKPIQPKPTILGDPRPAVPPALSDLREQKKRDHRADKASRRSQQQRTAGSDGAPPSLKAEQRSPPAPLGGGSITGWSCGETVQQRGGAGPLAAPSPAQPPDVESGKGSGTGSAPVEIAAAELQQTPPGGAARQQAAVVTPVVPAAAVHSAAAAATSPRDALSMLSTSRPVAIAAGGSCGSGGAGDNQTSPAAYSDISDDSSPERLAAVAAVTQAASGFSGNAHAAAADNAVSKDCHAVGGSSCSGAAASNGSDSVPPVVAASPAKDASSNRCAPLQPPQPSIGQANPIASHYHFSSGQSSQPVATVSPRKVGSDRSAAAVAIAGDEHVERPFEHVAAAAASKDVARQDHSSDVYAACLPAAMQRKAANMLATDERLQQQLRLFQDGQPRLQHQQQAPYYPCWPLPLHDLDPATVAAATAAAVDWNLKEQQAAASLRMNAQRRTPEPTKTAQAKSARQASASDLPSKPISGSKSGSGSSTKEGLDTKNQALHHTSRTPHQAATKSAPLYDDAPVALERAEREQHRYRDDISSRTEEDAGGAPALLPLGSKRYTQLCDTGALMHSHGGAGLRQSSPGSAACKMTSGEREYYSDSEKRSPGGCSSIGSTATGDMSRLSRVSPNPVAIPPPSHPLYSYSFPIHSGFGMPFDQKSQPEAATIFRSAPFLTPFPMLYVDPRMAANAAESREASCNGTAAAASFLGPVAASYSGNTKGQQHKIHELVEQKSPPLPQLRAATQKASSRGGPQPENGSVSRPPSRSSPAGSAAPCLTSNGSTLFSTLATGQGVPPFLQKQ